MVDHPAPSIGRFERLGRVDSTQRVVGAWLAAGEDEICVAVADEQTGGRGRLDRVWQAPPSTSLLVSVGFRPRHLALIHAWRIPAIVTLAMREAALAIGAAAPDRIALKWPNDLVGHKAGHWSKLAGVLSEGVPSDGHIRELVVGIGINVDWRRADFPPTLAEAMTSLRELGSGSPVDRDALLEHFMDRLLAAYRRLELGRFDEGGWAAAQVTTGAQVSVGIGDIVVSGRGETPDPESGALRLRDDVSGVVRAISVGDVIRCRIDEVEPSL